MDSDNWRPAQGTEPTTKPSDWRAELPPDSRPKIVDKIIETLKKHLPVSGPEGLADLQKIAHRFEEKIYTIATSQSDYLRKISLKMLTMENRYANPSANNMPSNQVGPSNIPTDQGLALQPQVHNPGQQHPNPMPSQPQPMPSQPQNLQQVLSQTIQNNVAPQSNLPSVPSLAQTPTQNIGQNSNTQNIAGQNSVGSSTIGQNSNVQSMFPSSQRQMLGRQHVTPQQQQQQSQNQQQILYQRQQLLKNKHQMSQMQQKQQQSLMQPNQLQSSQQTVMQTSSVMQSSMKQASLSSLPQNQQSKNVQQSTQSTLQQHSQAIRHQQQPTSIAHQQQTVKTQQPMLPAQQQQLMGSQSNVTNVQQQQPQTLGQNNNVSDIQQPQRHQQQPTSIAHQQQTVKTQQPMFPAQQQQLMGSQSNVTNVQQQPQTLGQKNNVSDIQQPQRLPSQQKNLMNLQRQQQLINKQRNLTNIQQQQQLGNNVPGLQKQQQFGTESGNQGMQSSHHSAHMLPPKVSMQQQSQQNASNKLPSFSQQSQSQASQQHSMSQTRTQPAQMQQKLGLQKQPNPLQRDMQQKLQQQSAPDQQTQLYQSQRALPETSTASADSVAQTAQPSGVDWQEEVYQKIQTLKENSLADLKDFYQKITMKIRQHESNPQQQKPDQQIEKMRAYSVILESLMGFLQVSKNNIHPGFKGKVEKYERQIMSFLNSNRPRRLQPGQIPPTQMPSTAQSQSQVTPVQSRENQMNSQLQPSNLQSSAATLKQNNIPSLQHNSVSSLPTAQHSMLNSMQPGINLDSGQGSSMNSLQQVPVSSLQQKSVSSPQQTNISSLPSQGGVNVIQPNPNTLPSGSSMLQHQLKHNQEQHMLQNQPLKQQYQQRHLMQRQQILQQPAKQQLSAQPRTHQMPQLHQMNDTNDMKIRQGVGVKPSGFQQHVTAGQHSAYSHQKLKQGGPFPVSSPQLLQSASPQIPQHSAPRVDQQNRLLSLAKLATLHSSNSPFVGPTPSPPMPGGSEKSNPGVSSLSNASNVGKYTGAAAAPAQSLTIATPGISASPLLAELSGPESGHDNSLAASSENSTTENPMDRLVRAVKSMSTDTLTSAVNAMYSVVSLNDTIAGSGPGTGSRAAVGEDLISITNCRVQARNSFIQDGTDATKRIRRFIRTKPSNVVSSAGSVNDSIMLSSADSVNDSIMQSSASESIATSNAKRPKVEVNHALLKEIREINCRLIDTVVGISDEDVDPAAAALVAAEGAEGTIVNCSYIPVALSPTLKSRYASLQSPIQPLRLLVPPDYPNCSPILLDKFPVESSEESEDLYEKTKSSFSISLRCLSQPMSVKDIAKTWDKCARGALTEYAQKSGGGTFSSKYGTWTNC